ncbi:hypothetical protein PanWU01x14_021680, partial [Parasponia andersonii]
MEQALKNASLDVSFGSLKDSFYTPLVARSKLANKCQNTCKHCSAEQTIVTFQIVAPWYYLCSTMVLGRKG